MALSQCGARGFYSVSVGLLSLWGSHDITGTFSLRLIACAARKGTVWCIVLSTVGGNARQLNGCLCIGWLGSVMSALGVARLGAALSIRGISCCGASMSLFGMS